MLDWCDTYVLTHSKIRSRPAYCLRRAFANRLGLVLLRIKLIIRLLLGFWRLARIDRRTKVRSESVQVP